MAYSERESEFTFAKNGPHHGFNILYIMFTVFKATVSECSIIAKH